MGAYGLPGPDERGIKSSIPPDWWRDFFGPDYILMYASDLTRERSALEVDCAVRALNLRSGEIALDLCCGFGRHLPWLRARGIVTVGVERSPFQLGLAKSSHPAEEPVRLLKADARLLPFGPVFDAVLCFYTSMGYFSDDENLLQLMEAGRVVKPGARIYIDNQNPPHILRRLKAERRIENAQSRLEIGEEFEYDPEERRIYGRKTVRTGEESREHYFVMRDCRVNELTQLLEQAGFEPQSAFGDYDLSPYGPDTPRLILCARKR